MPFYKDMKTHPEYVVLIWQTNLWSRPPCPCRHTRKLNTQYRPEIPQI